MRALLSVVAVTAGYGTLEILRGVSLDVAEGSVTALVGANGAGKTTLMRALAGLIRIRTGSMHYRGEEVGKTPAHLRVEKGVTLVPEGRMVFGALTVLQNLRLGAIAPRARPGAEQRLQEIFSRFPQLWERRHLPAASLSGGEQQMLAIGRGLMAAPRLLLLDEPSLGLAPIMVKQIFATIRELRAEGYGILLAEQNAHLALEVADHGCVMENGAVSLFGPAHELAGMEAVKKSYLGL